MSTRTQDEIFRFPDDAANTLVADDSNRIWTDTDLTTALDIQQNSFIAENAGLVVTAMRATQPGGRNGYDLDNVIVQFNPGANQSTANLDSANVLNGTNRFNNVTFVRNANIQANDFRLIFGNFIGGDSRGPVANDTEIIGCTFIANDSRNPIAILTIGFGRLVLQDTAFVGAVAGQFFQGFQSVGTTWAAIGANDGAGTGTGPYFARAIHQGIPASNNVADGSRLPNSAAIFLVNDDFASAVNLGTSIQLNHSSAVMVVNGLTGGQDIPVTFHSGGGGVAAGTPAGVYKFVGYKPQWEDLATTTAATPVIVEDIRIAFDNIYYPVVEYTTDPAFLTGIQLGNIPANALDNLDASQAGYRGFWIETSRDTFTAAAAGQTTAAPANAMYQAKSFTHQVYDVTSTAIPTQAVTNSLGVADTRIGSVADGIDDFVADVTNVFADPFVGTFTAATAPGTNDAITSLDDLYPAIKRQWYDAFDFTEFGLTAAGTTLDLNRSLTFGTSNIHAPLEFTINSTGLTGGTLVNTIDGNGSTIDLNSATISSMTIEGTIQGANQVGADRGTSGTDFSFSQATVAGAYFSANSEELFFDRCDVSGLTIFNPSTANATVTVRGTRADGMPLNELDFADLGTFVNLVQLPTTYSFIIDDSFLGIAGIAHRTAGAADPNPWTVIPKDTPDFPRTPGVYNFLTAGTGRTLDNIDSTDQSALFAAGQEAFAFTVGAGFVLTLTPITGGVAGQTTNIQVRETADLNYNSTVLVDASILVDVVEDTSTEVGDIDITITGTDGANGLDGAQTNHLIGEGRNDQDYLRQVWDGGFTEDYFRFPTQESVEITNAVNVTFVKGTGIEQQRLQGIIPSGFNTASRDGFDDVLNFPSETGLSIAGATAAINEAARVVAINNQVSYLITDGSDGGQPDRLLGIRPKRDGYMSSRNYTTNTE